MSEDFQYLEDATGEAGALAAIAQSSDALNDGLTKVFDGIFGPDEVDAFDASCNTCKHFARKPMTKEERQKRNLYGMPGLCVLKNVPVRGWQRGQYCGFENRECYENRRTGMRPTEACKPGGEAV